MNENWGWRTLQLAAFGALAALGAVGCHGLSCNSMGYSTGLHLVFEAHAPGRYVLRIDGDRVRGECPIEVDRQQQITVGNCFAVHGSIQNWGSVGSPVVALMGDDELPPAVVDFTVTRTDDAPGSWRGRVAPEYDESEPNGEGCGVAYAATATVHLPAPQLVD